MGFEQAGGTMTLFADKQTDRALSGLVVVGIGLFAATGGYNIWRTTRELGGDALWLGLTILFVFGGLALASYGLFLQLEGHTWLVPASQFQAINPLLIVVLAPMFSKMWARLDQTRRFRTSTPTKMAIGMLILGFGFVVMYIGQSLAIAKGKVGPGWLTVVYAIHTVGELCLSPIGLSMVTKLAPVRVVSLAMGLWLTSSAVANYLAGRLESLLEQRHVPIYGFLVVSSFGAGLALLACTPWLKKWMHGRE